MSFNSESSIFSRLLTVVAVSAMLVTSSACAPNQTALDDEDVSAEYDPLEGFNRVMHSINHTLDGLIIRPIASIYRGLVPELMRESVSNFLVNLDQPVVLANSVLQGDMTNAGHTLGKFAINTTAGIGGLFDVASMAGIQNRDEDFGQTLGAWGLGSGPYIVLPILGPSSGRDIFGKGVDFVIDPLTTPWNNWLNNEWKVARTGANGLDFRANNFSVINNAYDNSVDSYAAFRSMYLQNRAAAVRNQNSAK
jgi:phospholipid-binding lipoprotein MlaA